MIQKLTRRFGEAVLVYHSFARIHQTPALKARITDHKSSIEEMAALLPAATYPRRGGRDSS